MQENKNSLLYLLQSLCPVKEKNGSYSHKYKDIKFLDEASSKVVELYSKSDETEKKLSVYTNKL